MPRRSSNGPRPYAFGTKVSIEASRSEIERLVTQHGAVEFAIIRDTVRTSVFFRLAGVLIRHRVMNPTAEDMKKAQRGRGRMLKPSEIESWMDGELRRRWRALLLIIKGKLELVASGETTYEVVFLAETMLGGGQTVGEVAVPKLRDLYRKEPNGPAAHLLLSDNLGASK